MRPVGFVNGAPAFDPSTGPGNFDTGQAQMGGVLVLHNVSPWDLFVWFDDEIQAQYTLSAWRPRKFDFCGHQRKTVHYKAMYTPPVGVTQNTPVSYIWGESYPAGEPVPDLGTADPRLANVGNTVSTSGSSNTLKNDGNVPPTVIIEATPSDQTASAVLWNNDASGYEHVLSAAVQRTVRSTTRGSNTTTKAVIQFGDSGDTSITTFYGVMGAGSQVPAATVQAGSYPAGHFIYVSPANGSGNPDTLSVADGGGANPLNIGVSKTGDTINTPGTYLWDTFTGAFLARGGKLIASAIAPGAFATGNYSHAAVGGGTALDMKSGTASTNGDCFNLQNGIDTTYRDTVGIGEGVTSAFGAGFWIYDQKNSAAIIQNVRSDNWRMPNMKLFSVGDQANANVGFELGPVNSATAVNVNVDFHTIGNVDYNARILAWGGTSGVIGDGSIDIDASAIQFYATPRLMAGVQLVTSDDANFKYGKSPHGGANDFGIFSTTSTTNAVIQSSNGIYLKYNNYYNGTNDIFIRAAAASQVIIDGSGIRMRWSTNTPTAGGTITWGTAYPLLGADYASAAATYTNWPAGSIVWINSGI